MSEAFRTVQTSSEPCHEKTCLRVCDQARLNLACSVTEAK